MHRSPIDEQVLSMLIQVVLHQDLLAETTKKVNNELNQAPDYFPGNNCEEDSFKLRIHANLRKLKTRWPLKDIFVKVGFLI